MPPVKKIMGEGIMKRVITKSPELCSGCRYCEVACSLQHLHAVNPKKARVKLVEIDDQAVTYPLICRQCEKPACRDICKPKAFYTDPSTGVLKIDPEKCIGCGYCVEACPFGSIHWDEAANLPLKCDLCDGDPKCVKYCAPQVLNYDHEEYRKHRREAIVMDIIEKKYGSVENLHGKYIALYQWKK